MEKDKVEGMRQPSEKNTQKARKNGRRSARRDEGVSLVLFAIAIVPIIGAIALGIDSFRLHTLKMQQESNAEMAALAAMEWFDVMGTGAPYNRRVREATDRAEAVAGLNKYVSDDTGRPVNTGELRNETAGKVEFGLWSMTGACSDNPRSCFIRTNSSVATNAVKVTLTKSNLKTLLGGVVGFKNFRAPTSEAIVFLDVSKKNTQQSPYLVVYSG